MLDSAEGVVASAAARAAAVVAGYDDDRIIHPTLRFEVVDHFSDRVVQVHEHLATTEAAAAAQTWCTTIRMGYIIKGKENGQRKRT